MSELVPQVGWVVAFGAGVLSFFSPCVAPLVPSYLSYVSGSTAQSPQVEAESRDPRFLLSCLLFVLGFSTVFVLLGASASFIGSGLVEYRGPLNRAAGALMILMGLFILGILRLPALYRERRFHPDGRSLGRGGALVLGGAFGLGWTPCVGPILASILFYAGTSETAAQGALLLLAYSLGLGVPFLVTGLLFSRAMGAMTWLKRHYRVVNVASGGLLVGMGVLFITDRFFYFSILAQRLYYMLAY